MSTDSGTPTNSDSTTAPGTPSDTDSPSDTTTPTDPQNFWEEKYRGKDQVWSGKVNQLLAQLVADFTPGKSLDLGCGEGGDVVWLAHQGWDSTGIDISPTAIDRARLAATNAGLSNAHFVCANLSDFVGGETFDLVTATFLHSPVELDRETILRSAASCVATGGHLLIISHAAPPPWAQHADHMRGILKPPAAELALLALDPSEWETLLVEVRERSATSPDGEPATLEDGVILLKRR